MKAFFIVFPDNEVPVDSCVGSVVLNLDRNRCPRQEGSYVFVEVGKQNVSPHSDYVIPVVKDDSKKSHYGKSILF